jgi:glycosyltransferase involved in cell wall biosynthesis
MRIYCLHDQKYPNETTDTQQVAKTVEGLHARGGDVTLVIPRFPPDWLKPTERWKDHLFGVYGIHEKFPILGIPCPFFHSRIRAAKLYHGLVGTTLMSILKKSDDRAIIYSRNVPAILTGFMAKRRVLYETYKTLPTSMPALFKMISPLFHHSRFMGIITHSEYARGVCVKHGVPKEKIVAIHNGHEPREITPRLSKEEARKSLGLDPNGYWIGYSGNMQKSKNVDYLIKLVSRLDNAKLLLVGGTRTHQRRVSRLASQLAPGRVVQAGWVEGHRVPQYLYACDVLAIPASDRGLQIAGDTVLPMKLFQYLAVGRPLLVPDLPDTRELIKDGIHGIRTKPHDLERNTAHLKILLEDTRLATRMARNCMETAGSYTWKKRARKLLDFIGS